MNTNQQPAIQKNKYQKIIINNKKHNEYQTITSNPKEITIN